MDTSYGSYDSMSGFHPLPISYYENPTMFASAPAQTMKSQITRSHSQNSVHQYQQQNSELPPALISSASNASIPSATSSTVGSPYSGPINTSQAQNSYVNEALSHGLGLLPTIVNQDGYQHDFVGSGFDTDMPMGHDKMIAGNFVGEFADFSYSLKPLPNLPVATRQPAQSVYSVTPLTASPPELLSTLHKFEASAHVPAFVDAPPAIDVSRSLSLPATLFEHQPLNETVFKSPTTPASAYPRTPITTSPIDRRQSMHNGQPTNSSQHQPSHAALSPLHPMQPYGGQFQSHFFAQSSGNYMPPLETSCSFSLL